jgi:type VI secretion system VasD/TssJ family lipoprotein
MIRVSFLSMAVVMCVFLAACSPALKKPEWTFEKEAVRIHIRADQYLNQYNGKAHTLYVCFYQLAALNAFDQLAQDEIGIRKLLDGGLFDDGVASVTSRTVHPGEKITVMLDRAERAEYLAIVTGYYSRLSDERNVRRHKIQVLKRKESMFKRTYQCIPCALDIELRLGSDQIASSTLITNDKACGNECN